MKVQQTIAACIGWRRKYQKPFELIGVGVKQFHSGERKAALATKLSSWKSAILFNARPVARAKRYAWKLPTCVCTCVRVCARALIPWSEPARAVHLSVFFLNNDARRACKNFGNRSSIDLEKWRDSKFIELTPLPLYRVEFWNDFFSFFPQEKWDGNDFLLIEWYLWWCFLMIYRVVEVGISKIVVFYMADCCEFSNFHLKS